MTIVPTPPPKTMHKHQREYLRHFIQQQTRTWIAIGLDIPSVHVQTTKSGFILIHTPDFVLARVHTKYNRFIVNRIHEIPMYEPLLELIEQLPVPRLH